MKQLRYLDAVAREGHVGRAAARANVTQPAISMQIRELERALGVALFERLPKGVALTEAGAEILERARGVLRAADDLVAHAESRKGVLAGRLRLGVIPTIAPYLLPALLGRLAAAHPGLEPQVRETRTKTLLDELRDGALDVVLAALPLAAPDVAARPLFEDRFLAIAPAGAPYVDARAALGAGPLLLLEDGHCLRDQTLDVWRLEAAGEVSRFGASSLATLVEMVASGMGVTLIPEMSVARETRGRRVTLLRFPAPEPRRLVGLSWRKSSPRAAEFERIADAALAAAGASAPPPG